MNIKRLASAGLIAGILLMAGPGFAGSEDTFAVFDTGNELYQMCQGDGVYGKGVCLGVVTGAIDTFNAFAGRTKLCVPSNVTKGQVNDIVIKYLATHPEERHYTAVSLVYAAINQAWPCKQAAK